MVEINYYQSVVEEDPNFAIAEIDGQTVYVDFWEYLDHYKEMYHQLLAEERGLV